MHEINWYGCYSSSLKGKIHPDAFAHPAKMAWGLTRRIFEHLFERGWLKEGDLVADCFGGIGVTGLVAASFGCPCILVELEEKFVDLANKSFELHYDAWDKMGKPRPVILQGDSRNFSSIIREAVDLIITSPPYSESAVIGPVGQKDIEKQGDILKKQGIEAGYGQSEGQIGAMKEGKLDEVVAVITSPPYAESLQPETEEQTRRKQERIAKAKTIHNGRALEKPSPGKAALGGGYGVSKGQLGAMKEGDFEEVKAVITSPPYAIDPKNICHTKEGKTLQDYDEARGYKPQARGRAGYSPRPDNLGNLPEGDYEATVQGIVTSPSYITKAHPSIGAVDEEWGKAGGDILEQRGLSAKYGESEGQVAAMPEGNHEAVVNGIVTSPPYERSMDSSENAEARAERADGFAQGMKTLKYGENPYGFLAKDPSGLSNEERHRLAAQNPQIGQKQGDTYWEAVSQVYQSCYRALCKDGVMVVVVKDFVRNKKRVPLCDQTFELLQAIGFKPLERIKAWLVSEAEQKSLMPDVVPDYRKARKSFFRRLAERKGSPKIDWEEVLICQKTC